MSTFKANGICGNGHPDIPENRYSSYAEGNKRCKLCGIRYNTEHSRMRAQQKKLIKKGPDVLNEACDLLTMASANLWAACQKVDNAAKLALIERCEEQIQRAVKILRT